MRHIEYLRLIFLSAYIATNILRQDQGVFGEINEVLAQNNISIDALNEYISLGNSISLLTGFRLEQLTKDYNEMQKIYNEIVYNMAELIEEFCIQDDPIKVFALFTYLYRSGYLSYNKDFKYSTNMKDLPKLNGLDVVRGRGVCRSISSMFTDVCQLLGYTATNVTVRATSKAMDKKEQLSSADLSVEIKGRKFAKIAGKITSIIPIGNHLVTHVESDRITGIFDPTNDIFMNIKSGRKYSFVNATSATMTHSFISGAITSLLGQVESEYLPFHLQKKSKIPDFDYEEYKKVYKEMLEMIEANKPLIEAFYLENEPYYEKIYKLSEQQHGMIKRIIPIIPIIKNK